MQPHFTLPITTSTRSHIRSCQYITTTSPCSSISVLQWLCILSSVRLSCVHLYNTCTENTAIKEPRPVQLANRYLVRKRRLRTTTPSAFLPNLEVHDRIDDPTSPVANIASHQKSGRLPQLVLLDTKFQNDDSLGLHSNPPPRYQTDSYVSNQTHTTYSVHDGAVPTLFIAVETTFRASGHPR